MAIRIDPDTIYSRTDLAAVAAEFGLRVDTFLDRLKPRKVFKSAWLGSDILEAWRRAPALGDARELPVGQNRGNRTSRKQPAKDGGGRLIAGRFRPEDLGI